jgi:cysteinyl-tRNA synthetase
MVRMIKNIMQKGYAYEKEGSYYFNISKFKHYGRLAKIDTADLKPGQRSEADEYEKESIHDFALWKAPKPDEPYWETEIGPGRPGWHIECSAMSSKYLGESFDIHCGGVDNIFPHHENEIAQSETAFGKQFVRYWLHCQHLIRDGEKMSKSKGNIITIDELVTQHGADPMALRLLLLSTHYRKMLNFTFDALIQAEVSLKRIKDFLYELKNQVFKKGKNQDIHTLVEKTKQDFTQGLCDDLNISAALSAVFGMIKDVNNLLLRGEVLSQDAAEIMSLLDGINQVLGVIPEEKDQTLTEKIQRKIEKREKAREDKNYALADKIRDDLFSQGIILEDTKDGVRWKFKRQKT